MKLFKCIVDDGESIHREYMAAKSKKELSGMIGENATFEKIEDVTDEYFTVFTPDKLETDLNIAGWGEGERALICALVREHMKKCGKLI